MLLEDIEKQWAEDAIINTLKLADESLKIPKLHSKYYSLLIFEKQILIKLRNSLDKKDYILEQFFNKTLTPDEILAHNLGQFSDKKYMKSDIPKAISNHQQIVELKTKIGVQNIKIDFLESIIKQITNRNWVIRDAIEIKKFESGG